MGGSANGHYSGHAETYMNVGEGMGKLMAEMLLAKGAGGGGSAPGAFKPPARQARQLAPGQEDVLNRMLMNELVALSEAGDLKPMPVPLSMTKAKPSLVAAGKDNKLAFRFAPGKTGTIDASKLKQVDFANLAVLVTKLKDK